MTNGRNEQTSRAKAWLDDIARFDERVVLDDETEDFLAGAQNRFVLYAVDTDVVMCYTSPWNMGLGSAARRSSVFASETPYGVIFPPDRSSQEAANGLTYSIAKYIFFDLNTDWPLFQLPSHSLETERVFGAAAYNAQRHNSQIKTKFDQLEVLKEEVDKELIEAGRISFENLSKKHDVSDKADVEQSAAQILQILDELEPLLINRRTSPAAEVVRYLSLMLEGTLISTDNAVSLLDDDEDLASVLHNLVQGSDMREWVRESDERNWWMEKIAEAHKSPRKRRSNSKGQNFVKISADAAALARLVTINEKLEPLGGRLILITGAQAIHSAAKERGDEFLRKYIRHFHTFAPDAFLELESDDLSKVSVDEEIRSEFGYGALQIFDPKKLRSLLKDAPDSFDQIEKEWIDFRDKVIRASVGLSHEGIEEVVKLVSSARFSLQGGQKIEDLRESLGTFAHKVRQKILEDRLSLAAEFAATGVEFLLALGLASSRNPPDVKFDSYKNANELFHTLRSARSLSDLQPPFRMQLERLRLDCEADEVGVTDLGYLYFLVFSGLFAAANRWNIAADLAGHAIEIASLNPRTVSGSNVSGREAYYLRASARRLGAREASDFGDALDDLRKAREALEVDKKDRPGLRISPLRFDAEEVAISIGELHFRRQRGEADPIDYELVERARIIFDAVLASESDDAALVIQCAVNGLQTVSLFLLAGGSLGDNSKAANFISQLRNTLRSLLSEDRKEGVRSTLLMEAYQIFSDIVVEPKSIRKDAVQTLFSRILSSNLTTVYDQHRFTSLRDQCLRMMEA